MAEEKPGRAASYSVTDEQETLAVTTFRYLTDHKKVKLDIKERDKYPNIDGYVELVDDSRAPIAKLEVQIRKLPDNKRKLQCPIKLLNYAEKTCNPVLFIGVDTKQKKAYWIHVSKELFADSLQSNQKTKVVSFPAENVVDGKDSNYISEWSNIAEIYQRRIHEFQIMERTIKELSTKSNAILGIDRKEFQEIHLFLDEINALLDGDFFTIKNVFYPDAWKIGLAYYEYKDNIISYALYPIPIWRNDVQIKEISSPLRRQTMDQLGVTAHYTENPIKLRPTKYAIDILESKMLKILENRLLIHTGSEFLAREFIFAFIDRFHQQLGLEKKNEYSLNEIEKGFFKHLPFWTHEAMKFMVRVQRNRVKSYAQLLYRRPYFDPDKLIVQIMGEERKQIGQVVEERIKRKDSIPAMPLGNDRFPFRVFVDFFSFLKSQGVEKIERVYLQKDFSRFGGKTGWIWNVFSPDVIEKNLIAFFRNLSKAYDQVVTLNFPKIKEDLPIFGAASKTIVLFDVKENYKALRDAPSIEFFHLKTDEPDDYDIELYRKDKGPGLSWKCLGKKIEIAKKEYTMISGRSSILDFIYDDLPMFNFIYELLKENLKGYFKMRREQ